MKHLFLLLLFLAPLTLNAIENQFLLRIGAELAFCTSEAERADAKDLHNNVYGVGFSAGFGYVFTNYEFGLSSHVFGGAIEDFHLEEDGESLVGDGTILTEHFTIYAKRYTNFYPFKYWRLFVKAGPSVTFNTIKLREFSASSPEYTHNHKVTSDAVGGMIAIGIEENALKKSSHPNYIEVSYSVHRPTRYNIVDASDYTQVENVYQSRDGRAIAIHTIMVEAGFVLF